MNKITKKTVFGTIGVAAAGLLALGAAAPAMASTGSDSTWDTTTSSYSSTSWMKNDAHLLTDLTGSIGDVSNDSPIVIAPEVGVGDILGGDIASGNAVASGNDVTAPVASGNDTPIASGNDTSVGNDASLGNGNSVGTEARDLGNIDGTVDGMVDADYHGRGVCRWKLIQAQVQLQAPGAQGGTRFVAKLNGDEVSQGTAKAIHYWKARYPSEPGADSYRDYGQLDLQKVPADQREEFFNLVLTESAIIGLLGAAAGVVLSFGGSWAVAAALKQRVGLVIDPRLGMDWTLYVVAGTVVLAAVAGVVPAVMAYRTSVANNLRPLG